MAEIERLSVVWDARFDKFEEKLNRVIRSTHGTASKIEKRLDATNDNIARRFGKGVGGTLNNELQGIAQRAGPAAAALGALGPAGIAAAVGITTLGAAFAGAREAAAFSDEIADTAKRLHVTTDALQEYRFAIRAAGGDEAGADEALERFSVTLGNAQRGMVKAEKAFLQLGFKKEQIASMNDADAALTQVAEKLQGLSQTRQDSLIKALGLEGLKPLLQDGVAEMERLRAEAHKVGVVMDADLIKRGAELNDQFETVARVIDIQMKSALVDLGPILVGLLGFMAELIKAANDVVNAFRGIENKSLQALTRARDQRLAEANSPLGKSVPFIRQSALKEAAKLDAEIARRSAANVAPAVKPTRDLVDVGGGGGGRSKAAKTVRDTTAQRTAEIDRALRDAERDFLSAWDSLLVEAENRAEIQRQQLALEIENRNAALDSQQASIQADEGLSAAKKAELAARLELVRTQQADVDKLRAEAIERGLSEQKAREATDLRQADTDLLEQALRIQQDMSRTAADRRRIELGLLDLADQRVRLEQEAIIASKDSTATEIAIAKAKKAQLEATRAAREANVRSSTRGPLEEFFDRLPRGADEINEAFQRVAAGGLADTIDGLAQVAAGMTSIEDFGRQMLQQLAYEVTRVNLQALLAKAFPGLSEAASGAQAATAITTAGTAAGGSMGAAITASGATAAQGMGAAIVAAGSQAATAIAAAMASGGATGGASSALSFLKLASSFAGASSGSGFFFNNPAATGPFNFTLPAYANGTNSARGGLSLVGENGPELVNLRRGAQVIPNDILRTLARNRATPTTSSRNFSQTLNINLSGAGMSVADARRTAAMIGSESMRHMAIAKRRGY